MAKIVKKILSERKIALIRILTAICLVIVAFLLDHYKVTPTLSVIVYVLAYGAVAYEVIFEAGKEMIKEKTVGEKLLMTVASLGALVIGEYMEASLVIILYMIGEIVEDSARDRARKSIESLAGIRSDKARIKGGEIIPAGEVKVGDIIEVFPGERIPLDGEICDGAGAIDTSVITGESLPKDVRVGKEVLAGCLNLNAVLCIKVKRPLEKSASQRIIDLAEKAQERKTKNERFIKKFARIYTPSVIGLAVLVAFVPPLIDLISPIFGGFGFEFWIYKALAVLAVSCPCALVISVPLSYFCGIGYASKRGVLIKSSESIDVLRGVEIIAFDKTGTLTGSELHVNKLEANGAKNKIELLEIVGIAEMKSNHPIAIAVVKEAKKFNIELIEGENYVETPGYGVECDSPYGHIKAGNRMFVDPPTGVMGTVYVSVDGKYVGAVGIGDELKANSKIAFEKLRKLGVKKKIILSGDKKSKVDAVARTLLAETAYSNLKPEDKLHALEDIIASNPDMKVAYCGDGINDTPTLARADIGIAMGAIGSDAAVESSDVIIMDDNIEKVPLAIRISKKTHRTVISNIVMSLVVKTAMLILLGLPFIQIKMLYAVLADVGILIVTIINSLRAGRQ